MFDDFTTQIQIDELAILAGYDFTEAFEEDFYEEGNF